jgi:phage FluMu protein Com
MINDNQRNPKEIRCKKCNKKFFDARHADLEIVCSRCGTVNEVKI